MTQEMLAPWASPGAVLELHSRALRRWQAALQRAEIRRLRKAAASAFYQAGVRCHRSLILREVVSSFEAPKSDGDPDNAVLALLPCPGYADRAALHYDIALAFAPHFAEAHYNRASLHRRAGRLRDAMQRYLSALAHPPHAAARPHAHLHANAAWESAKIAQRTRRSGRTGRLFRKAMSGLDNFGVDHRHFPDYLERSGRLAEAMNEYDRVMSYSHRHAPEFIEPNFDHDELLPRDPGGASLDPLVPTVVAQSDDATAVYFLHLYFSTSNAAPDTLPDDLLATLRRSLINRRRARMACPIETCAPSLAGLPKFSGVAARPPHA